MNLIVSVGEFREKISDYLDKVSRGNTVIIRDHKKGQEVAQVTARYSWDAKAYRNALKNAAGIFTAERHPEWRTLKDVESWLRETRRNADRTF